MRTVICLLAVISTATTAAAAPSLDDILAKNRAAHGGDKLTALSSLRVTGKIHFGGGDFSVDASYGAVMSKDGFRVEVALQGLTQINAYDGKIAWKIDPFQGRRDPERLSADEAKGIARQAEFIAPVALAKQRGHKIDYLGTEDVDGTPAYKLRITRKDGDIEYAYLDPDSYLEIRLTSISKVRGVEQAAELDLGDYEQAGGVWIPFAIELGEPGGKKNGRFTVDLAEPNVPVDAAIFKMDGAKMVQTIVADKNAKREAVVAPPPSESLGAIDSGTVSGLGARNIGSATMSGRIAAVAAHVDGGKTTIFVGAASGGVWRSQDGGTTFKPVFDKQSVQSIGAITIDPSDPKTIWVGTGEAWTRNSVSFGDGIYKSTDNGETWTNMGLPESERIVRILVHPKNSNVVYACVPGKLFSDSKDRGVYKTTDGGKTWTLALSGANLSTGCSGLTMDPKNPDVLIAGMWDFRRKAWTFRSGGDGPDAPSASGMFKTTDGGAHWTSMMKNSGLPAGPWGRVEVVFAPSDNKIVYAMIESKASALFRSSDGGNTWEQRDHSQHMVWRPFYFARLVVDPSNPNRIFKPDLTLIVSDDGGSSFSATGGGSHGDWHDVWIDPANSKTVIGGDDGGFWLSYDGGNRWWKGANLPISQFYHVSVDDKDPYNVYGGLQDNSSWIGPSAYPGGITNGRWENLYGGDGFWTMVDPSDPDGVYAESQGGNIGRVDHKTLATRDIQPRPAYKEKLRFNWNTPIATSPTSKGTIYIGAQFLFRSRDKGDTWQRISPDLTTNDPEKQKQEQSGGVTVDNSSAEMHTTIYSISESPKDANLIWVGTDDGNLQVTRDSGKTWTNVVGNIADLPKNSWVSWVEASRYDAGTAFATFDRHTAGDFTPWVYRTTDYGKTWTRIVGPDKGVKGYAHVIKEDSVQKSLLFVGTELGMWISVDGGTSWAQFKGGNFPAVAVRDIAVQARDGDLVLATHGRGIWIIDDLTALRNLTADTLKKSTAFLPGRATQQRMPAGGGWAEGDASYAGENPNGGAVISYYLRSRHVYGEIKLDILDDKGKVIDSMTPTKHRGINRVTWSMQVKAPRVPRAAQIAGGATQGPRVVPGTYTLRLTRGSEVVDTKLVVGVDKRAPYNAADRKAQFDGVMKAHKLFDDMSDVVDKLDALRAAVNDRVNSVPATDALGAKLRDLSKHLDDTKKMIVATTEGGAITGEERIREHLDGLYGAMNRWEGRPAKYQLDAVDTLRKELDDVNKNVADLIAKEIKPLDDELKKHNLQPIPLASAAPPHSLDEAELECVRSAGELCKREAATAERD